MNYLRSSGFFTCSALDLFPSAAGNNDKELCVLFWAVLCHYILIQTFYIKLQQHTQTRLNAQKTEFSTKQTLIIKLYSIYTLCSKLYVLQERCGKLLNTLTRTDDLFLHNFAALATNRLSFYALSVVIKSSGVHFYPFAGRCGLPAESRSW